MEELEKTTMENLMDKYAGDSTETNEDETCSCESEEIYEADDSNTGIVIAAVGGLVTGVVTTALAFKAARKKKASKKTDEAVKPHRIRDAIKQTYDDGKTYHQALKDLGKKHKDEKKALKDQFKKPAEKSEDDSGADSKESK